LLVPQSDKGIAGGIATLDITTGKLPSSQIPSISVGGTVWTVASQAAMLALSSAIKGDLAVRTDLGQTFILTAADPTQLANWTQLPSSGAILSVNGHTGTVVLSASDVGAAAAGDLTAETSARIAADSNLIPIAQKGAASGIASLDSGGKLLTSQLPPLAIVNLSTVNSQAAMIALTAQRGDIAIRTDLGSTWLLTADDPTQAGNWVELVAIGKVSSVNGSTGAITITAASIGAALATDLASEITARQTADTTETAARIAADTAETTARQTADTNEASLRAAGDASEASARATAVSAETTARQNADALLVPLASKGQPNGVASLDSSGVVFSAQLPPVSITNTFTANSQAAMLALSTARQGDIAIRTDVSQTYILTTNDPTVLANWQLLPTSASVVSVQGQTGVVSLTLDELGPANANYNLNTRKITGGAITTDADGDGTLSTVGHLKNKVPAPIAGGDDYILTSDLTGNPIRRRLTPSVADDLIVFVSSKGNDANTGRAYGADYALKTLQAAVDKNTKGNRINCAAGVVGDHTKILNKDGINIEGANVGSGNPVSITGAGYSASAPKNAAPTGDVTSGDNVLRNVSSFSSVANGYSLVGIGIQAGATVSSFSSSLKTITMSAPATTTIVGTPISTSATAITPSSPPTGGSLLLVNTPSGAPASGVIRVGYELISYASRTGGLLNNITRGAYGTTPGDFTTVIGNSGTNHAVAFTAVVVGAHASNAATLHISDVSLYPIPTTNAPCRVKAGKNIIEYTGIDVAGNNLTGLTWGADGSPIMDIPDGTMVTDHTPLLWVSKAAGSYKISNMVIFTQANWTGHAFRSTGSVGTVTSVIAQGIVPNISVWPGFGGTGFFHCQGEGFKLINCGSYGMGLGLHLGYEGATSTYDNFREESCLRTILTDHETLGIEVAANALAVAVGPDDQTIVFSGTVNLGQTVETNPNMDTGTSVFIMDGEKIICPNPVVVTTGPSRRTYNGVIRGADETTRRSHSVGASVTSLTGAPGGGMSNFVSCKLHGANDQYVFHTTLAADITSSDIELTLTGGVPSWFSVPCTIVIDANDPNKAEVIGVLDKDTSTGKLKALQRVWRPQAHTAGADITLRYTSEFKGAYRVNMMDLNEQNQITKWDTVMVWNDGWITDRFIIAPQSLMFLMSSFNDTTHFAGSTGRPSVWRTPTVNQGPYNGAQTGVIIFGGNNRFSDVDGDIYDFNLSSQPNSFSGLGPNNLKARVSAGAGATRISIINPSLARDRIRAVGRWWKHAYATSAIASTNKFLTNGNTNNGFLTPFHVGETETMVFDKVGIWLAAPQSISWSVRFAVYGLDPKTLLIATTRGDARINLGSTLITGSTGGTDVEASFTFGTPMSISQWEWVGVLLWTQVGTDITKAPTLRTLVETGASESPYGAATANINAPPAGLFPMYSINASAAPSWNDPSLAAPVGYASEAPAVLMHRSA
jgi:hypothetical protein